MIGETTLYQVRTKLEFDHKPKATLLTGLSATPLSFSSWVLPTASIREKELDLSARRSHSARVVAARRKKEREERNKAKAGLHNSEPTDLTSRPLALPALLKGNSDPFDSFSIHISPHINRMVVFARDSYYPSMTLTPWRRLRTHRKQQEGLHFFELGWSSADCAVAHLASYGAALIRILPTDSRRQLEQTWLEVRYLALQRLRNSLATYSSAGLSSVSLVKQCLYLYKCDVEARLFSSARIHGTMLRHLFKRTPVNSTTICLFLSAMGNVLQFVCFQLEAPVMTYDDWYPSMWRYIWTKTEDLLASRLPHLTSELHYGIKAPYLREVLSRFRMYLATPDFGPDPSTPQGRMQLDRPSLWPVSRIVDDTVKLFAHFQTLMDQYRDHLHSEHLPRTDLLWQAVLALSTLCTIRHYLNSPHLDDSNIDLRDASSTLAPLLRTTLVDYLHNASERELVQHAEVLFWVYFTGALYEQRSGEYHQQMLKLQMQTLASTRASTSMEGTTASSSTRSSISPNTSTYTNTTANTPTNTSKTDTSQDSPCLTPSPSTSTNSTTTNSNSNTTNNYSTEDSIVFYFTKNLARQAQHLHLQRWADAQKTLGRVAYSEELLDVEVEKWWEGMFEV